MCSEEIETMNSVKTREIDALQHNGAWARVSNNQMVCVVDCVYSRYDQL